MPLCGVYGFMGSGKNIFCVYYMSKFPNLPKYVNFHLELPNTEIVEPLDLFDLEETEEEILVCYDEAYTEMDNRLSLSDRNRLNSYLLAQSRKRNMNIFGISQLNNLDIRWKGLEQYIVLAQTRRGKDIKGRPTQEPFIYWLSDKVRKVPMVLDYRNAKKLFPLYKTEEVILPHDIEQLKTKVSCDTPEKLNALIDGFVETIIQKVDCPEKITRDWVRDTMLRLGLNLDFWNFVYIRLKNRE